MSGKQEKWCRIGINFGGFEGECVGHSLGDESQTLTRATFVGCQNYMKPIDGNLSVTEPST